MKNIKLILTVVLTAVIVIDINYLCCSLENGAKQHSHKKGVSYASHNQVKEEAMPKSTEKTQDIQEPDYADSSLNNEDKPQAAAVEPIPSKNENNIEEIVYITTKELLAASKLSISDKIKGYLIIRKFNKSERKLIYKLSRGGFTYSEIARLKKVLSKTLSKKDIANLYLLLKKSKRCYAKTNKKSLGASNP
ncbi:MAG TPA: hypothetical protein VHT34_03335 [Clostridia bacterium]|nr:hypothetical protein [Clostridia bacterium]